MGSMVEQSLYLSTVQAAEALGVSVSTVKRWVDEGVLPAHRTAGGHRKLARAEVLALARQGSLPRGDLGALIVPSASPAEGSLETVASALLETLLQGQGAEARAILQRAYRAGATIEALADQVIGPVMARVGHEWETSRIDVWHEHRGTQLCASALHALKDEVEARAERDRPIAIGGTPEGDPYQLATLLSQLILLDAGWEAVNLGPNVPMPSLTKALRELRPRLVWLSVSYLEDVPRFIQEYRAFFRVAERQGAAVMVGGPALREPVRSEIACTRHGENLSSLAAFAQTLHPRPKRPRRGRPPRR